MGNWKHLNLVDYLTGHCSNDERREVEEALEKDSGLRTELSLMRREIEMMRSAGTDPYAERRISAVQNAVMNEIRESKRAPVLFNSTWLSYFRAVGAVLALIAALVLFFFIRPGDPRQVAGKEPQGAVESSVSQPGTKPVTIQMSTNKPNVKIIWTLDPEFPELD